MTAPRRAGFAWAAAGIALLGTVVSGPLALVVSASAPLLPFFAGFLLVGGFVGLLAALVERAADETRARVRAGAAFGAVFGAMIVANYALQLTLVPTLGQSGDPFDQAMAARLSMTNPQSLGWGIEMWGYAVLGVATWLAAPAFGAGRVERVAAALFVANGPVSILGAVLAVVSPGWVLTGSGLAAYALWNALVVAMLAATLLALRPPSLPFSHGQPA